MAGLFSEPEVGAVPVYCELTSDVTVPVKHVNVNMPCPNKDTLLTAIILYDEMRISTLIHLCQKNKQRNRWDKVNTKCQMCLPSSSRQIGQYLS